MPPPRKTSAAGKKDSAAANKKVITAPSLKQNPGSTLSYTAEFDDRISRLFIFRKLWLIIEVWVLIVWAIWIAILSFLHFWYMLILGRRSRAIWDKQLRFARHVAKWQGYLSLLINRRPLFIEN